MFLQPESEPFFRLESWFCQSLEAACCFLQTSWVQPAASGSGVVKGELWPCSFWPLVSGLRAIPRPLGGNQTLLIDSPNLMIEYWVSIDRRQAIFIHDFRRQQKPRLPRSCHVTSRDELTPSASTAAFAVASQSDSGPPRESSRKWGVSNYSSVAEPESVGEQPGVRRPGHSPSSAPS